MNGGSGDASAIADVVRNTYGWNVMKPDIIDNELWDNIYDTYIADENHLGVKEYFSKVNHAALQEMTAVMLETIRKGMWSATPEQISAIAELHTEMVNEHGASCSGFVCDNAKLRDFIRSNVSQNSARQYNAAISSVRAENISSDDDGMVMKREEMNRQDVGVNYIDGFLVGGIVIVALIIVILLIRHRRKTGELK